MVADVADDKRNNGGNRWSNFRCLVKSPSWPEFLHKNQKFKHPQRNGHHGWGEKGLHVQKSRSSILVVEQCFSKEEIENHSSDLVARQVMFGNEMKINKLAPWPVNDLSSAVN